MNEENKITKGDVIKDIIMGISRFESSDWSIEKNFWHI